MRVRPYIPALLLLAVVVGATAAGSRHAVNVSGQVQTSVSISASDLDFGRASFTGDTPASARIYILADGATTLRISLDGGSNVSRVERGGTRYLLRGNGVARLPYWLYQDAEYRVLWGDDGTSNLGASMNLNVARRNSVSVTVYGKVRKPALSNAGGVYEDIVTVSVDW